jgi:hypothetical protein
MAECPYSVLFGLTLISMTFYVDSVTFCTYDDGSNRCVLGSNGCLYNKYQTTYRSDVWLVNFVKNTLKIQQDIMNGEMAHFYNISTSDGEIRYNKTAYWSDRISIYTQGLIIEFCDNNHGCCIGNPCDTQDGYRMSYFDNLFKLQGKSNDYLQVRIINRSNPILFGWDISLNYDVINPNIICT